VLHSAEFLDWALPTVFAVYVATVGIYLGLQVYYAARSRRRQRELSALDSPLPSVDVIVPCFNESPATLDACLESLARQDYAGRLTVYVVDDGSPNREALAPVYEHFREDFGYRVMLMPKNVGKRFAQCEAIRGSDGEIIVAVDSDTMIAPDGVRRLVQALDPPGVGAAMGEMLAANRTRNWLTRLIDLRYWYACNQERAAQSHFGAVLCCSGPFSAYRREVFEKVLEEYLDQTFLGRPSTYGEDRYLTNLILRTGSQTVYASEARALTMAPERMRSFLRQQLRWNRCTYRDTLNIARHLPSLGGYLVFDAFIQVFAPALLGLSALLLVLDGIVSGPGAVAGYIAGLAAVAVGYCAYGVYSTRKARFALFALYGALHVGLLIPNRVWAMLTISDDRWGRRGADA
jgi:N-acetylglucosaminyltransferase